MASSAIFECISARTGTLKGNHLLILYLASANGVEAVKFFNTSVSTPGRYKVSKDSDFSKLHRLTTGRLETKRLSGEAHQLARDFIGHSFKVSHEPALDRNKKSYQKVTSIVPREVKYSDDWTSTGTYKQPKSSGRQNAVNLANTGL